MVVNRHLPFKDEFYIHRPRKGSNKMKNLRRSYDLKTQKRHYADKHLAAYLVLLNC
jgi:hypothetical protein